MKESLSYPNQSPMAWEALQRISVLYAIEAEGKALGIAERQQLRAAKSQPQLRAFHDWLLKTRTVTAPGGASAKALDYTLKRWPAVMRKPDICRLTTTPWKTASGPLRWARKIGCLPVPNVPGNVPPQSKPYWARPSLMA